MQMVAAGTEFLEDMMSSSGEGGEAANSRGSEVIKKYNLSDRFTILTDNPIKELTTSFSRSFEVRDSKQKQNVYAIILPNSLPIRFKVVQQLKQFASPNFCNVIDSGFSDVARGEFGTYSVIVEKPRGQKLADYISKAKNNIGEVKPPERMVVSEDFIATEIVAPINEVLKQFAENEISHGRINHENIYIDGQTVLGECISEPCGYSQPHQFEPIERAQAIPLGKGNSTISSDYFALGVVVLYCIFGDLPGRMIEVDDFIALRLAKGTYNTYFGMLELSPRLTDLLRGLLTDNTEERWGYEQVYNWLKGKKYNLIRPKLRKESIRNYEFTGVSHINKRQLAFTYAKNWDEASIDLRDRKIAKWLELSVNDKVTADSIISLMLSTGGEKSRGKTDDDELVAKAIILLDPVGPLRYRNISMHIDGIGVVLANAWQHQNHQEIQYFSDIIKINLIDYKAVHEQNSLKVDRWVLQRLQNYIKAKSLGFGLERCLYDLNPSLPCQSPLTSTRYIVDINQLLYFLNDHALKLQTSDPVDRHVAAFLASRLDISQEIKLKAMRKMHDEKIKNQLVKLALLAFAQKKSGAVKLSGLAEWMAGRLKVIVESLHSRRLRKDMAAELKTLSEQGNLEAVLQLISTSEYFSKDHDGFMEAQKTFSTYDSELKNIRVRQGLAMNQNVQYQNGLYLAKILGAIVFVLTLIIMVPKSGF